MIRRLTAGLCALLAVAAMGIARADDGAVRKEMMQQFDRSVAAWKKKDVKGFMSMFSPNYEGVGTDGKKQTYKAVQAEIAQNIEATKAINSATFTIDKLATKGNKAELDGTMKMSMVVIDAKGEMGPKGGTHKIDVVERSHETWEKTGGQWKLKSMKPIPGGTSMMDGKPMGGPPQRQSKPAKK